MNSFWPLWLTRKQLASKASIFSGIDPLCIGNTRVSGSADRPSKLAPFYHLSHFRFFCRCLLDVMSTPLRLRSSHQAIHFSSSLQDTSTSSPSLSPSLHYRIRLRQTPNERTKDRLEQQHTTFIIFLAVVGLVREFFQEKRGGAYEH